MESDEKRTSVDDETPPDNDSDMNDGQNGELKGYSPYEGPMSAMKNDNSASNTISFLRVSSRDEKAPLDPDFGMPNFGFLDERPIEKKQTEPSPAQGAIWSHESFTAARTGLERPPLEGTGWEDIGSIELSPVHVSLTTQTSSTRANAADDHEPAFAEQRQDRNEAKVMPFPGSPISRANEPEPSEILRGSNQGADDYFEPHGLEPAEALPDFDMDAHDSIAQAVQSALRNVYGARPSEDIDAPVDMGGYTVAESLRRAAAADAAGDVWAENEPDWHDESREPYLDSRSDTGNDDVNTEAVLDYLYSNRRAANREREEIPSDTGFRNDDGITPPTYDQDWPDDIDIDRYDAPRSGIGDFSGDPYRGPGGHYSERGDRAFAADQRYRELPQDEANWAEPSYAPRGMPQGQYPAPIPVQNPESLAAGTPDSSHLLGAAGLGLIGGIALAGVLAVFVFNSFLDENEPGIANVGSKVVERLTPQPIIAASQPAPDTNGIVRAEAEAEAERQAALQAEFDTRIAALRSVPTEPETVEAGPVTATSADGKLKAADVSGLPGATIPLNIEVIDSTNQDAMLISLKGLPVNARLSIGIDVGGGQWLLPPSRLGDLSVTAPEGATGGYDLEAQLLQDDAQTPLSQPVAFKLNVGQDFERSGATNALPFARASLSDSGADQAAQLAEVSEGSLKIETDFLTQMLIQDGNKLMRDGDILGARRLYEQAAANSNPEAALAMGRSFDPSYFEKLPVKTGKPDPATAFQWYKKALDGGLVTARVKIDGLKQWLQR